MLAHIQKMIEELKDKIKHNAAIMNKNQEAIESLMKEHSAENQPEKFDAYKLQNKMLLSQNNDLINVHLTLLNFMDKYKETAILDENLPVLDIQSVTDDEELFSLTIKGRVPFDSDHPQYNHPPFIDKLIGYYERIEDYEKCQELLNIKANIL
jgi:hypothetical protein